MTFEPKETKTVERTEVMFETTEHKVGTFMGPKLHQIDDERHFQYFWMSVRTSDSPSLCIKSNKLTEQFSTTFDFLVTDLQSTTAFISSVISNIKSTHQKMDEINKHLWIHPNVEYKCASGLRD